MLGRGIFWGIKCSRSNASVPASEYTVLPAQGQGPGWALGSLLEAPSEGFPQKRHGFKGLTEAVQKCWLIHHPSSIIQAEGFLCKINVLK